MLAEVGAKTRSEWTRVALVHPSILNPEPVVPQAPSACQSRSRCRDVADYPEQGGRVDSASSWVCGKLRRQLPAKHPLRVETERLAKANGNINSGVGWHARKMEVCNASFPTCAANVLFAV
ncbi:hypothetical protein J3R82DRAFT_6437 [Butyriboletus roseoflavus]|nr:hypothetical protein J3R82DRAFT_6437 [Butyriboletus roseoflavus]